MYSETPVNTLAVWYRADLSEDGIEFEEVLANMFCGVERRFEYKLSAAKTRPSTVVLVDDPQLIK